MSLRSLFSLFLSGRFTQVSLYTTVKQIMFCFPPELYIGHTFVILFDQFSHYDCLVEYGLAITS